MSEDKGAGKPLEIMSSPRPDDDRIPVSNMEFEECPTCAAKPGTPELCPSCIHNREIIMRLQATQGDLASALQKFAPDLMDELVRRYEAADGALEEFLATLSERA